MLHSPLTGSFAAAHRPVPDPVPNGQNTLQESSALPTILPPILTFPGIHPQIRSFLGTIPSSLPASAPFYSNQSAVAFGPYGTSSLSGSSSLSSSLASLHSIPPVGPTSERTCQIGISTPCTASSAPRCSLWLKLRVCPSYLAPPPPSHSPASKGDGKTEAGNCAEPVEGVLSSGTSTDHINQCPFSSDTCPYAHPTPNVRVENGYVTVCYDFIKRKSCKHSCCKYYHPPPHQIEAVLKRGDEQKKLLENQKRQLESKPSQPSVPNGLSTSGFPWSSTTLIQPNTAASVYGTYLATHGQTLPTQLNPMTALSVPFGPGSDPGSLNTSALLAAAAAVQQQQGVPSQNLFLPSPTEKAASASGSYPAVSVVPGCPRPGNLGNASSNGHCVSDSGRVSSSEPWLAPKRLNCHTGYSGDSMSELEQTENSSIVCNGTVPRSSEELKKDPETLSTECSSNLTPALSSISVSYSPAYCPLTSMASQIAPSGLPNMLSPLSVNLYGLPFPTPQAVGPSYMPTQFGYPSVYSTPVPSDGANSLTAAAVALSNLMTQQQQQQTPQLLTTQVSGPSASSTSALAAALAAFQQQQPSSDVHAGAQQSSTFQQQQQQQQQQTFLLSAFLRAQQAQLAAAQMAAAVQAAGGAALLHPASSPRPNTVGGIPGACVLDSSYPIPSAFSTLQTAPYVSAVPAVQNPITNVAYINEKGHLLETLPICRDFKAGKCHRNGDCRYVHLVDENVEINQGRVIVCRDAAKGRCTRVPCKYYHIPLFAISANRSMALNSALASAVVSNAHSI
ncbi:unnamed protein product [Calicophoron daubneyi]|uniref:C3H1-type domain-containing protein n=1 Tax=Calicophoron daubneyi TaxID=300641 RepID=A0AAV2TU82_CALDB